MGYERKRGKLNELNALLRGALDRAVLAQVVGDTAILGQVQYVITLDTDTQLPRDAARQLVGTHGPSAQPAGVRRTSSGASSTATPSCSRASASACRARSRSRFARICSPARRASIPTRARCRTSTRISSAKDRSSARASTTSTPSTGRRRPLPGEPHPQPRPARRRLRPLGAGDRRRPVSKSIPPAIAAEASRRHRWIRGDWQIAGWLLPARARTRDGRRERATRSRRCRGGRSSTTCAAAWSPPSLLLLLLVAAGCWLAAGRGSGRCWSLAVVAAAALLIGGCSSLLRKPEERALAAAPDPDRVRLVAGAVGARSAELASCCPTTAVISLDAIVRRSWRLLVHPARAAGLATAVVCRARNAHRPAGAIFSRDVDRAGAGAARPRLSCWRIRRPRWSVRPAVARCSWLAVARSSPGGSAGRFAPRRGPEPLQQRAFLRTRRPADLALLRDVRRPRGQLAAARQLPGVSGSRPSPRAPRPTNIGMALLANLAAYDFGYISAGELLRRGPRARLRRMERLERFRGHFYNWYDTRTLQPLDAAVRLHRWTAAISPASLLTLQAGLLAMPRTSRCCRRSALRRVAGHAAMLAGQTPPGRAAVRRCARLGKALDAACVALPTATAVAGAARLLGRVAAESGALAAHGCRSASDAEAHVLGVGPRQASAATIVDDLADRWRRWMPTPASARHHAHAAAGTWCRRSANARRSTTVVGPPHAAGIAAVDRLAARATTWRRWTSSFLYDSRATCCRIGYDVASARRDPSCYDLLASEARLASFCSIAQGQVPQKHWFALGRLLTSHGGDAQPDVVERLDVRVPHAAVWSCRGTRTRCWSRPARPPCRARSNTAGRRARALGHLRVLLQRRRHAPGRISTGRSACPGWASNAGLADDLVIAPYASRPGADGVAAGSLPQPADAGRPAVFSALTGSTRRSTTRPRACRGARTTPSCAPSWRITRG